MCKYFGKAKNVPYVPGASNKWRKKRKEAGDM